MAYQAIYRKWRPAVFEENVTVILAVYRDDKPVAFKAAQTKLTAGTKARRVQLTLDIPEGEGRLAAEYFMISSFDSRKPYSKVIAKKVGVL